MDIFNIKGKLIKSIDLGGFSYSNHDFNEVSFTPFNSSTSSGIYILKLYLDDYTASKKIIYLKWKKIILVQKMVHLIIKN